jgi:hypothetical protein
MNARYGPALPGSPQLRDEADAAHSREEMVAIVECVLDRSLPVRQRRVLVSLAA